MKFLRKSLLGVAISTGVAALFFASASAAVVCVGPVCWHSHETYDYPRTPGLLSIPTTGAGDLTKNTHGGSTKGAAIGAVISGWNGSA